MERRLAGTTRSRARAPGSVAPGYSTRIRAQTAGPKPPSFTCDRMTTASAKIESLLRSAVIEIVEDWHMIRRAERLFSEALQLERYADIERHEEELDFWARGMALHASQRALTD